MPHLDEGRLTALIDGELDALDRRAVEDHLAGCDTCKELLAELQAFAGEADRLVNAIEVPPLLPAPPAPGAGPAPAASRLARYRTLAWAASLVLAVGLGYTASALRDRRPEAAAAAPATVSALDEMKNAPAEATTAQPAPEASPPAAAAPQALGKVVAQADADAGEPARRADMPPAASARNELRDRVAEAAAPAAGAAVGETAQRALAPSPTAAAPSGRMRLNSAEAPRQVHLEEAVASLGGTIRLVGGLTPVAVLIGRGDLLPGADPARPMVRVVYLDPPGRELWLEQQAPAVGMESDRLRGGPEAALIPGDTLVSTTNDGRQRLQWIDQTGFHLGLTGFLPADSMRSLLRQVH